MADWRAATLGQDIGYDIETTPIQLRTWADKDGSQLWIKFKDAAKKTNFDFFSFKFNQFSLWLNPDCNKAYGIEGFTMTNVPQHFYRTWTIFKTSTHMKIECNKVEVWSVEYKKVSDKCHSALTRDSSFLEFTEHSKANPPSPTIFYRPSGEN